MQLIIERDNWLLRGAYIDIYVHIFTTMIEHNTHNPKWDYFQYLQLKVNIV